MNNDIRGRFFNGLMELTGDADAKNYKYYGGNKGQHLNYLILLAKKDPHLSEVVEEVATKCVCGNKIEENCYIFNKRINTIVIVGSCCIKKFIPQSGRTCEICSAPHRNRVENLCNKCFPKCTWCGKKLYAGHLCFASF